MRFASLRGKGLGVAFPHEFSINLDEVPGPLVAVTGENGAGKTTLLELLGGAMYRVLATRGSLNALATGRDSFLEVDVVNGSRHRIRHVMDMVSGKAESVVTDEAGVALIDSGKVRAFDAWATKHLPPREVFYASMFAAQGSGGFIAMKPAERKAVLLRVLGIEHLETLAKKAREHAAEAKAEVTALTARIDDERARSATTEVVQAELDAIKAAKPDLESAVALTQAALDQATAAEQIARLARQDIDAHMARRGELVARLQTATTKAQDVERRLKNNQGLIDRAEEIRGAVARMAELDAQLAELTTAIADATAAVAAAKTDLATTEAEIATLSSRISAAQSRETRARERLADRDAVEAAAHVIPGLREQLAFFEADAVRFDIEIRDGQDLVLNSATTRITGLRAGLEAVAEPGATGVVAIARDTLSADDETAAKITEAPKLVEERRASLARTKQQIATVRTQIQTAERTAARATEIANAAAEAEEAASEIATLRDQLEASRAGLPAKTEAVASARTALAAVEADRLAAVQARGPVVAVVKFAEPLTQAEARLAELQPQLDSLRAEASALTKELEELGDLPENVALPDLGAARARVDAARDAVTANQSAIAVKESQLEEAKATAARLAIRTKELRAAQDEVSDWTRLADDLGRDGLQALEIDAAGPELTALVNDLLHTCVGSRWTVSIQASRLSADGKKVLEGCEVSVLDTLKGREGEAETLSGGEGVIVGEAVSLALSMLACRRSGVQGPTLVRDETGAALDPANARAYVAMLRRACEIVGASRCFFVSHNPDVQALADARIEIAGGKVSVAS